MLFKALPTQLLGMITVAATAQIALADQAALLRVGPCGPAIQKLCPEPDLSTTDLFKCLDSHPDQTLADCRKDLRVLALDLEKVPEKCRADVIESCPNITAGKGKVLKCLKAKHRALSPACRVALETMAFKGAKPASAKTE